MRIFDRIKSFVNDHPIATGITTGSMLLLAGMPIAAGASTLFIGTGAANATIKFISKKITTIIHGEKLPLGTIRFKDRDDRILFEFNEKVPDNHIVIKIPASPGHKAECYKVNSILLESYCLYRKAIIHSYGQKSDLAQDIKKPKQSKVTELDGDPSYETYVTKNKLNSSERGLDQYSIAACLHTMKRWKNDAEEHMQSFIAYEIIDGYKTKLGFVLFQEKIIDEKPVIYIAAAGVSKPGTSIGRRLMECVLTHFPAGTEFHILTRKFNSEASDLYGKRLGFELLNKDGVAKLNYDPERYIGFKHVSTQQELALISGKQSSNIRPTIAV